MRWNLRLSSSVPHISRQKCEYETTPTPIWYSGFEVLHVELVECSVNEATGTSFTPTHRRNKCTFYAEFSVFR